MPVPISLNSAIDKSNTESGSAYLSLVEVTINDRETGALIDTIRAVNNNEDITFESNLYTATSFDLKFSEVAGEAGNASLFIEDHQRYIRQQEEALGGPIGFSVRVMVVNSSDLTESPDLDMDYSVTSSTSKGYVVSWNLGAENALSLPFPKFKQYKDRCRHKYGGEACGFTKTAAQPTCSLSLDGVNGCADHGNTINFGGLPGLKQ